MIIALVSGVDLFFVENTSDLLIKVVPSIKTQQVAICYSFHTTTWDTVPSIEEQERFSVVVHPPESIKAIGIFCLYDNNAIDDNNGELYLFEVCTSPRFIHEVSLSNLNTMLIQARKKVISKTHVDEAIYVLDYVRSMINIIPYIPDSDQEFEVHTLRSELNTIYQMLKQ
jgi:hypothetical protein